jgi:glycosyltransferase involved in cell wall biosynthesis
MPLVSVIVPNYNHARYLPKRLDSIVNQTFDDIEIILLDDASSDESLDVLKSCKDERARLFPNRINSGSPFAQWNKGVELASGKYIWIAESDDIAELQFFETLVPVMEANPNMVLNFAQSMLIDAEGKHLHTFAENYRFLYNTDRWESDFIANGKEECTRYLLKNNTIPNASAVLMRRDAYIKAGGAPTHFKLNGDWLLYARVLVQGSFGFNANVLNYFRTHENTQRHKARRSVHAYPEMLGIQTFIEQATNVDPKEMVRAKKQVAEWWIGGIAHQHWFRKGFWRENAKLYRIFSPLYSALWLRILWHIVYAVGWYALYITGVLRLGKRIRNALFPGKYFNPNTQKG